MKNEDSEAVKMFAGLFGSLIAMAVILFVLAHMIVSGADINPRAGAAKAAFASQAVPAGHATIASRVMDAVIPTAQAAAMPANGKAVFEGTCVACHGPGIVGAPKFGDKAAWAHHIAKGLPTLYKHALNGFHGHTGTMPPHGGNPSLTTAQVEAAVRYMVSHSR